MQYVCVCLLVCVYVFVYFRVSSPSLTHPYHVDCLLRTRDTFTISFKYLDLDHDEAAVPRCFA